jgi:hypothetical protein
MHIADGTENHVTTFATVATRRPGKLFTLFMLKTQDAVSAVARLHIDCQFINKCHIFLKLILDGFVREREGAFFGSGDSDIRTAIVAKNCIRNAGDSGELSIYLACPFFGKIFAGQE